MASRVIKQKKFSEIREERKKPKPKPSTSGLPKGGGTPQAESSYSHIREMVAKGGGTPQDRQASDTKAKDTFFRLAAKADLPVSRAPDLQKPPSNLDSGASDSTGGFTGKFGEPTDKGSFFAPSAEEGAARRQSVFGTESKAAAGAAIGVTAAALIAAPWIGLALGARAAAPTAVSTLATVGTRGLIPTTAIVRYKPPINFVLAKGRELITQSPRHLSTWVAQLRADKIIGSSASKFAANGAARKFTQSWLQKLLTSTKTVFTRDLATGKITGKEIATSMSGKGVLVGAAAGLLVGAIGSYPFAGFIEEESLQTLGFGVNSAKVNGDFDGAEEAIALNEEILNPDLWSKIMSAIPFANVLSKLAKFREAAAVKVAIDKRHVNDLRIQAETGETDSDMWARIRAERDEDEKKKRIDDEAYYANVEAQRAASRAAERKEEEAYWVKIIAGREKEEKDYVRREGNYYQIYYQTIAGTKRDTTPSKLNFGLL